MGLIVPMDIAFLKNIVLLLMVYSTFLSVVVIAYFVSLKNFASGVFSDLNRKQRGLVFFAGGLILSVVILFVVLYVIGFDVDTNLGQIGDFVGGILNPLLSFAAFIAVLVSISVQEKDLAHSNESVRSQEQLMKVQAFETSFYNLISMMRQRRLEYSSDMSSGQPVNKFNDTARKINTHVIRLVAKDLTPRDRHRAAKLYVADKLTNLHCNLLRRQFRMVTETINANKLTRKQKRYYYKLYFADLSSHEKCVLVNIVDRKSRKVVKEFGLGSFNEMWMLSGLLRSYYNNS